MDRSLESIISTKTAPGTTLPLSQATVANRTVYVSGCLGISVETGELVHGGAKNQTDAALKNLQNVLLAAGSNLNNVLKTTVYIQDFNDFPIVNEAYKNAFVSHFPARTCIQVAKLPLGALVEIEAIAAVEDVKPQYKL